MARDESENFRVRPGRSHAGGARLNPRTQPFLKQVQIAVRKAGGDPRRIGSGAGSANSREGGRTGRFNARGRGAKAVASFAQQGSDGAWQTDSAGRFRARRVVVKARVIRVNPQGKGARGPKMRGTMSRAVDAHLRYLERDGVTRDGERGKAYSAFENEAGGKAFVERGREDRHQFRFIVAPEDATEMADLRGFTRDLTRQMELDLETRLDWIAVDHHNTGHPHTHVIDLRPGEGATFLVRENRNLVIGRVQHLQRYGIATELEPGRWYLSDRGKQVLKDLDHRNEAINSIHRALTKNGLAEERGVG